MILMTILLFVFIGTLEKLNAKLDLVSKNRIEDLDAEVMKLKVEMTNMRDLISKDFHDEMGNKLASISMISQMLRHKLSMESDDDIQKSITEIDNLSKELYNGTRDFVWSIKWDNDNLSSLLLYIREFGEKFFNNLNINYSTTYDEKATVNVPLNPEINRQIILVCKEIFTNSAKHALCTEVFFECAQIDNFIEFKIRDNGIGFDKSLIKTKNGISNIQFRCNKINATLALDTQPKNGTMYIIKFQ